MVVANKDKRGRKKKEGRNYIENWCKFDFHDESHEKPIKIVVLCVYFKQYAKLRKKLQTKIIDSVEMHIFCLINLFRTDNSCKFLNAFSQNLCFLS